ncbi:unnamed protein product [Phyllotreta striolata]|uniref:Uncharacterized protein n=1 Tax=Phyllotreta striolata TaxID=444603 RepID=A0A9N9XLG7_PHYSR|nr:unnamed protein product [Phyllotreta striolata]
MSGINRYHPDKFETGNDESRLYDFKTIINQYDENVVNVLMPFMVNILDCMNVGYREKKKYEAKLKKIVEEKLSLKNREKKENKVLLKELQDQMVRYQNEHKSRLFLEAKLSDIEKRKESEVRNMMNRVEALEVLVQTLEHKFRESTQCIEKLEEKEADLKREYSSLLERYTKLFKEHVEYLDKSKPLNRRESLLKEKHSEEKPRFNETAFADELKFEPHASVRSNSYQNHSKPVDNRQYPQNNANFEADQDQAELQIPVENLKEAYVMENGILYFEQPAAAPESNDEDEENEEKRKQFEQYQGETEDEEQNEIQDIPIMDNSFQNDFVMNEF